MALVAAMKTSCRTGSSYEGGMDTRGTPGGPGTGTPQFRYQTRPVSLQGICLNGGEESVDGDLLLGCQTATGTQDEPARIKIGKG